VSKRILFLIFICVIVETSLFRILHPIGWIPQVSFLIMVFSGLRSGPRVGLTLGCLLGLFLGSLGGEALWLMVLLYGLVGWTAGMLRSLVFLESPVTQCLVPAAFFVAVECSRFFMLKSSAIDLSWLSFWQTLPSTPILVTMIIAPLVFMRVDKWLGEGRAR